MQERTKNVLVITVTFLFFLIVSFVITSGCNNERGTESRSGARIVDVEIPVDPSGVTIEQKNVRERLIQDNKPGSIKHLYVFSAYTGTPIIYSTVMGKVTSSGKRLSPNQVYARWGVGPEGFKIRIGGETYLTKEVLSDDGVYGQSAPYLYWFDSKGIYHQHYVSGGQIVHISDQPIAITNVQWDVTITATE